MMLINIKIIHLFPFELLVQIALATAMPLCLPVDSGLTSDPLIVFYPGVSNDNLKDALV